LKHEIRTAAMLQLRFMSSAAQAAGARREPSIATALSRRLSATLPVPRG